MEQLRVGTARVYLDFMIMGINGEPLIVSYFDRASQTVRAVNATLTLEGRLNYNDRIYSNYHMFTCHYATVQRNKEQFTHGMAFANNLKEDYFVTEEGDMYGDLYNFLMNKYSLPLMEWWMKEVFKELVDRRMIYGSPRTTIYGNRMRTIKRNGMDVPIERLKFFKVFMTEDNLKEVITSLFNKRKIWITKKPQKNITFDGIDDYFQVYGKSIVDNLKNILKPVSELNGKIDKASLMTMQPYPQQAAMVNGVYEYFRKKISDYALLAMGTGSGKTMQAALIVEQMYVSKWLENNPGKTIADAYAKDGVINYRHFIMCPGHLVRKWKNWLEEQIPYAKPVIVNNFSQLVQMREDGRDRCYGKEWYIMSKDFTKLSYQRIPTPKKEAVRYVHYVKCKKCGVIQKKNTGKCLACSSEELTIVRSSHRRKGLICPSCNRLLYPTNYSFEPEEFFDKENRNTWPMHWYDMKAETNHNQNCIYCGESLWTPFVKTINTEFGWSKEPNWIRQTFWANKSKKGKVTNWVLRGYEDEAESIYGEVLNSMDDSIGGCRKYSPALYIKKYLKGYIDVFICDEVHKSKGGSTAQGNAFHQIRKASKYTLGLTGTIAGGMATDLFYLLYRLEPERMKAHGYDWGSVVKFAQDYGCVETEYEAVVNRRNNACSRGRQLNRPKVLPGISPLIFSEFLLDRAVFLDIGDMSEHMPPLYEYVKLCGPQSQQEGEMHRSYELVIDQLKGYEKSNEVNLTSIRNQFSMSYLDKPYGADSIRDPMSGEIVVTPKDYRILIEDGNLLAKERMLVDIVNQELSEGRNCVIYAEYTQSEFTNVMPRLQTILTEHCNLDKEEIVVMKANYPSAAAREEWMHRQAEFGMKVMICNPRLCETGLDFCWKECGVIYNYPTLIFYQAGYSLYVMWQAAGRAWRLNQREECRTYYLAYEKTVQQAILQVLAEKKASTAAIQGRFSADGLVAMAKGVDTQVRIAQIMSEIDTQTENTLQKMFDVIANEKTSDDNSEPTITLFDELVGEIQKVQETVTATNTVAGAVTLFGMLQSMQKAESKQSKTNAPVFASMSLFNSFVKELDLKETEEPVQKKTRKKKYKVYDEVCSLF